MLTQDPQLVPADILVRYLATFQRFLTATIAYNRTGDKAGMLLVGHLAGKLRNVPEMLWHYDDYYRSPAMVSRWVGETAGGIRAVGAPERLVQDCERIFSTEDGATDLGLRKNLADIDLAPLPDMREYLDLLYHACLSMMRMTTHGTRPSLMRRVVDKIFSVYHDKRTFRYYWRSVKPWQGLERAWTAKAQADADANRRIAEILLPVPQGLAQWSNFDEDRFRNTVCETAQSASELERLLWSGFLNGWTSERNYWTSLGE